MEIFPFEYILQLKPSNTKTIIATNQNFDYLQINEHAKTFDLFNTFLAKGYLPAITKPTRVTHSSAILIDNIYTNKPDREYYKPTCMTIFPFSSLHRLYVKIN